MKKPTLKTLRTRARNLRQTHSDAERLMWYYLRDRRLDNFKFIRQEIIDRYIVDFICREKNLILEIDGSQHLENKYDEVRTQFLKAQGYQVLRFWNNEVLIDIESVLEKVLQVLDES